MKISKKNIFYASLFVILFIAIYSIITYWNEILSLFSKETAVFINRTKDIIITGVISHVLLISSLFIAFYYGYYKRPKEISIYYYSSLIGIVLAMSSQSIAIVSKSKILIYPLIASLLFLLFPMLISAYKNKKITVIFGSLPISILVYFLSLGSGVLLNEIFHIDSSYFIKTQIIVFLIILSTLLTPISYFMFIFVVLKPSFNLKKELPEQDKKKKENIRKEISTYALGCILYLLLMIGIITAGNAENIIINFATTFDFNEYAPCHFEHKNVQSSIILDPSYKYALTYIDPPIMKGKHPNRFIISKCHIDEYLADQEKNLYPKN